jgi:hypothetical protein
MPDPARSEMRALGALRGHLDALEQLRRGARSLQSCLDDAASRVSGIASQLVGESGLLPRLADVKQQILSLSHDAELAIPLLRAGRKLKIDQVNSSYRIPIRGFDYSLDLLSPPELLIASDNLELKQYANLRRDCLPFAARFCLRKGRRSQYGTILFWVSIETDPGSNVLRTKLADEILVISSTLSRSDKAAIRTEVEKELRAFLGSRKVDLYGPLLLKFGGLRLVSHLFQHDAVRLYFDSSTATGYHPPHLVAAPNDFADSRSVILKISGAHLARQLVGELSKSLRGARLNYVDAARHAGTVEIYAHASFTTQPVEMLFPDWNGYAQVEITAHVSFEAMLVFYPTPKLQLGVEMRLYGRPKIALRHFHCEIHPEGRDSMRCSKEDKDYLQPKIEDGVREEFVRSFRAQHYTKSIELLSVSALDVILHQDPMPPDRDGARSDYVIIAMVERD